MSTLRYVLLLIAILWGVVSYAQGGSKKKPAGIGGESTTTSSPIEGVPQVISADIWLRSMRDLDSLKIGTSAMIADNTNPDYARLVSQPGKLTPYQRLNIHVYLQDLVNLQFYFIYGAYRNYPVLDKRTAILKRVQLAAGYPLTRRHIIGEYGLAENPRYMPRPHASGEADEAFRTSQKKYGDLQQLYEAVLERTPPQFYAQTPAFFYEDKQRKLLGQVNYLRKEILAFIQPALAREIGMLRASKGNRSDAPYTQEELDYAIDRLSRKTISGTILRQITTLSTTMTTYHEDLIRDFQNQQAALAKSNHWLNPQEKELLTWVNRRATALLKPLSSTLSQIEAIKGLSLSQTNYAQLIGLTEQLRILSKTLERSREWPARQQQLERITQDYRNLIQTEIAYFVAQARR